MRNDESFDLFWDYFEKSRTLVDVSLPTLPRRRKLRRFEVGESEGEYPTEVQGRIQGGAWGAEAPPSGIVPIIQYSIG